MNDRMYLHPGHAGQPRAARRRAGSTVIPPGEGELASHGEHGVGRLAEPAELLGACEALLDRRPTLRWSGARVLVTAGGTREPIDSVRYIGNRSSGRMGFALAARGRRAAAPRSRWSPPTSRSDAAAGRARDRRSQTAAELAAACEREFDALRRAADGRRGRRLPARRAGRRTSSRRTHGAPPTIELEPTEDVLSALAAAPARRTRCWSASPPSTATGAVAYGRGKLERKRLDAVVVNDISRPEHRVRRRATTRSTIVTADGASGTCRAGQQGAGRRRGPRRGGATAHEARGGTDGAPSRHPVAPQESEALAALARRLAENVAQGGAGARARRSTT